MRRNLGLEPFVPVLKLALRMSVEGNLTIHGVTRKVRFAVEGPAPPSKEVEFVKRPTSSSWTSGNDYRTSDWKESTVKIKSVPLRKTVAISTFPTMLVLSAALGHSSLCYGQAPTQPDSQTRVAAVHEPVPAESDAGATHNTTTLPARSASAPDLGVELALEQELASMKLRMEQISAQLAELKLRKAAAEASSPAETSATVEVLPARTAIAQRLSDSSMAAAAQKAKIVPFSDWDWTCARRKPKPWLPSICSPVWSPTI